MTTLINSIPVRATKTYLAVKLGVSRSSLYYVPQRDKIDQELKYLTESVMSDHPAYGHKRIAIHLKMNKKRILRIMKKYNLKPYRRRGRKLVKKDDLGKSPTTISNHIKYFCPIRPCVVWVTDFTYIMYMGRFIYLSTVMDMYTREIVGVAVSRTHASSLVLEAMIDALASTGHTPLYAHSDQGSEYDSQVYMQLLTREGILPSMSKKASPWENGFQESYYGGFKLDLGSVEHHEDIAVLIEHIYQTIHYYNHKRIHTSLKMTPVEYKLLYVNRLDRQRA